MQKNVKSKNHLYPVFLKLEEMSVLLVGAGNVGLEKLESLLGNSPEAAITVVAPFIKQEVRELLQKHPACHLIERGYDHADLEGKDIVVLATDNPSLHKQIKEVANAKGLLVNVADTPDLCDFYLGSIVQKGSLKIAISTNGKSPTASKRIRQVLDEALPGELDEVLQKLHAIRNKLSGDFSYKVKEMNRITQAMVEKSGSTNGRYWRKIAKYCTIVFVSMIVGYFIFSYLPVHQIGGTLADWYGTLDSNFHWMVLAGFMAQMVDGATSMGYGVTSSIILQSAHVSPAAISGGIHTAEMFTSGASGYSHYRFGNVNKKLFRALLIPGVIGAVLGALLLVKFGETHIQYIRPIMAAYTMILGIRIFTNAFRNGGKKKFARYGWLAGVGGFLDSFGGGGWGPIVTSTLITKGRTPRFVVGSVSLTEFFVTLASAITFFTLIGLQNWQVVLALIIGGVLAAPIAARLAGKLPRKTSFLVLGTVVMLWSLRIILKALL